MKVLLAVDGSPYTQKMLEYLKANPQLLAEAETVTALTVREPLPPRARAVMGKEAVDELHAEASTDILNPIVDFLAAQCPQLNTAWDVGRPGAVIAEYAEDGNFDLIVMGSHGSTALGNLVMGSVATRVLARCAVPVLLVR